MRLIDADKAEGYFYEHLDDLHIAGAMNAINEMPAIEAEPVKHGKWLGYPALWECSECGKWIHKDEIKYFNYQFCPHCGAKMENPKGE